MEALEKIGRFTGVPGSQILVGGLIFLVGYSFHYGFAAIVLVLWIACGKLGRWLSESLLDYWPLVPTVVFGLVWGVALALGLQGLVDNFHPSMATAGFALGAACSISNDPVQSRHWLVKAVPVMALVSVNAYLMFG